MTATTPRINNFSPGPAILPLEVLETVRENLFSYRESGIGVMELSHRGPEFEEILTTTETTLRELLDIGRDYAILFPTGGATAQFSMIPQNLLGKGQTADYVISGIWAEKAFQEAQRFGTAAVAATSKDKNFSYIPKSISATKDAAYLHFTSNNTIVGTQFRSEPKIGGIPLVCDASSDLLSREIDISRYSLVYAGAQKNLGIAGVTVVIIERNLLARVPKNLALMSDYTVYDKNRSIYNTPPTFPIYVMGEVFQWIKRHGGLREIETRNERKAQILYSAIDTLEPFEGTAEKESRSRMNVTFRLKKNELEPLFIKEAAKAGFSGLEGHRLVGGMRASIYNAFPEAGVLALADFMKTFASKHG